MAVCQPLPQGAAAEDRSNSAQNAPLPVEQIAKNLQERNAQRAAALHEFNGTRVYRMQYRGFPSDRDAEMVVNVSYRAPNSKEFVVVSQSGSKLIIDRVFKKLLEGEQEAANDENRRNTTLTTDNYDFTSAGYENTRDGERYVLNLLPRGTHEYARFIRPSELSRVCRDSGLRVNDLTGMTYNPFTRTYSLGRDVDVNYLLGTRRD